MTSTIKSMLPGVLLPLTCSAVRKVENTSNLQSLRIALYGIDIIILQHIIHYFIFKATESCNAWNENCFLRLLSADFTLEQSPTLSLHSMEIRYVHSYLKVSPFQSIHDNMLEFCDSLIFVFFARIYGNKLAYLGDLCNFKTNWMSKCYSLFSYSNSSLIEAMLRRLLCVCYTDTEIV